MLSSFIDGRVRIRHAALKDAEKLAAIEAMIGAYDGVLHTLSNSVTGSLLVEYDPQKIPHDVLLAASETLREELEKSAPAAPKAKCASLYKYELLGLGGCAAAALAGVFLSKRLHVVAGTAFFLMAGRHVHCRRRRIAGLFR